MGAADVADAHVVVHHALHIALEIALEQAHEEVDLGAGAAQIVFQRKGVEREPGQADARGGFRDQLHALGALLMAEEALQRAVAGPAAVAIHDDGDVLGQALGLERRIDRALLRGQLIDTQRASWMQRNGLDVYTDARFGFRARHSRQSIELFDARHLGAAVTLRTNPASKFAKQTTPSEPVCH